MRRRILRDVGGKFGLLRKLKMCMTWNLLDVNQEVIYSSIVFHLSLIVNQSPTNNNWGEREIHR